jgi:hypothetical protein
MLLMAICLWRPGLFVAADIEGRTLADVLAIPSRGLRAGGRVLVMNDDDLLEVRSVIVAHMRRPALPT